MVVAAFGLRPHFALPPTPLLPSGSLPRAELATCVWVLRLHILALSHWDTQLRLRAYQKKLVCQPGATHLLLQPLRPFGRREGLHFPTCEMLVEKFPLFRA